MPAVRQSVLSATHRKEHSPQPFQGFEYPKANFIFCPNDFFEVCLRYHSRVVVRIVAYILRETLGTLDEEGKPVKKKICFSYLDIARGAGVSPRSVRKALDDAIKANFIVCVTPGVKKSRGNSGQVAEFQLCWSDKSSKYTNKPSEYTGFYSGEGFRSPIPNGFFDIVIRNETLAVTKVVGTVLRHTVGYADEFGTGRRKQAPLSFSYIQKFANIKDRTTLWEAVKNAVKKQYIQRVSHGYFDKENAGKDSRAGVFAVKWLEEAQHENNTAKSLPNEQGKNPTGVSRQNPYRGDGKKPTGLEEKPLPDDNGKNPTDRKTSSKTSYKQQVVAVENSDGYRLLLGEGIGKRTAVKLSERATLEEIQNQIKWVEFRCPQNRPAMLCKAIEENWSMPEGMKEKQNQDSSYERDEQTLANRIAHEARVRKQQRRSRQLAIWRGQTREQRQHYARLALEAASGRSQQEAILDSTVDAPADAVLEAMERALAEPIAAIS